MRNPVLSRAKRGDMRGKYMISKQIAPRRRCEAVNATLNAANAARIGIAGHAILPNCSQSEQGTPEGSQPCVTPY